MDNVFNTPAHPSRGEEGYKMIPMGDAIKNE
jgi:hypothetical protein